MLDFFEEFLVDCGGKGFVQTGLDSLWWFVGFLNRVLEQKQGEVYTLFDSQPDSTIFMEVQNGVTGKQFDEFEHVGFAEMAVLKKNPATF